MPAALEAALTSAAISPVQGVGWLRVTGEDRVRWLNGMVTNSIQALNPGQGCYNFVLNAQGRIQADCTAWLEPDAILLETANPEALASLLDRFIIMDDVELEVLKPPYEPRGLHLVGPGAPATLQSLGLPVPETMQWQSAQGVIVMHAHSPLVPRFELLAASSLHLPALSLPELAPDDLAALRLLEGTPLLGVDIRDRDLPQEAALPGTPSRALHFSKGCYLGQEIVERIRSRGQVHRTLHGLRFTGDLPAPGTPLSFGGKPVGEITSAGRVPLEPPIQLGLAMIRREAFEGASVANPLVYAGGTAEPVRLPYDLR